MPSTTKMTNAAGPDSTETYTKAQAALAAIADRLRASPASTSVDTLLGDVREARRLHAVLRERLEAVRREIDEEVAATEAVPA